MIELAFKLEECMLCCSAKNLSIFGHGIRSVRPLPLDLLSLTQPQARLMTPEWVNFYYCLYHGFVNLRLVSLRDLLWYTLQDENVDDTSIDFEQLCSFVQCFAGNTTEITATISATYEVVPITLLMIANCSDLISTESLKFKNFGAVHSQFASVAAKYKFEINKKDKEAELNSNSCSLFKTFLLDFMKDTGT